jgi:hypothetical protein
MNMKKPNCKDGKHWTTDDIYAFIESKFVKGKNITIVSGVIHKEIGLLDRHPMVCGAMKRLSKKYSSRVISTPESEQGATLTIDYLL